MIAELKKLTRAGRSGSVTHSETSAKIKKMKNKRD